MMYTYKQLYDALPCKDGLTWLKDCEARGLTLAEAWDECSRSDWMFWALEQLNIRISAEQDLRLQVEMLQTPLADGRVVEDLLTDERSRAFVALKRKRLSGEVVDGAAGTAAGTAAWAASRMDGFPGWPAGQGHYQYPYEPPRTLAQKTPHQRARLQALGNAVVWQQVYPLAQALTEWLSE